MSSIKLYKNNALIRTIEVNDSGIYSGKRDYLGPDMPEFRSSDPDWNEYLTHILNDVQGEYIKMGGHVINSSDNRVYQTSAISLNEYTIIIFSVRRDEADKVVFEYKSDIKEFDLSDYSTVSKKFLAFVLTASNECSLMDLLHMNDKDLRELKAAIETLPMTEVGTEIANKWHRNLINEGGRFGKEIVASVITEDPLDQRAKLESRFTLVNVYEVQ